MKKTGILILTALPVTLSLSFYCCAASAHPAEELGQLTKSLHQMQFIVAAIVIAAALYSIVLIAGLFLFIKKRSGNLPRPSRVHVPCERVAACPNDGFEPDNAIPVKVKDTYSGRVPQRKLTVEEFIAEVRRAANAASEAAPDNAADIQDIPNTEDIPPNEFVMHEATPAHDAATCSLFAEALRHATGADISLINCGGIRGAVDAESITEADILKAFPFEDTVTVLGLTGAQLREVLEHSAALLPEENGRYLYASGIIAEPDASMPTGERVGSITLPNDAVSGGETEYIVAVNDYIANGGDGYDMLAALPKITEGQTVVQAVFAYVSEVAAASAQESESMQLMNAH